MCDFVINSVSLKKRYLLPTVVLTSPPPSLKKEKKNKKCCETEILVRKGVELSCKM